MNTCAFTGHREIDENKYRPMTEGVIDALIRFDYEIFLSGMAIGFDMLAAEAVLAAKERHKDKIIELVCVLPCTEQTSKWPEFAKKRYNNIIGQADKVVVISEKYTPECYAVRNRYLVDNSELLIARFDGRISGGTAYTVKYAGKKGIKVNYI